MNELFTNLPIKNKIFILILIPVVIIIFISSNIIYKDYKHIKKLNHLKNGIILSTKISSLVHEIQKERGISIMFLGRKSDFFKNQLKKQYFLTNNKLKDLNNFIKEIKTHNRHDKNVQSLLKYLNYNSDIVHIREKLNNNLISVDELLNLYTAVNEKYLQSIANVSKISMSSTATSQLVSYFNFLLAKETVGIQRAIGASILTKDEFQEGVRVRFSNLIAEENLYISNFLKYTSIDTENFYKRIINHKSIHELNPIINKLLFSSKKAHIVSNMQNTIGYGGLIHNFKNFVIRKDDKYADKVSLLYVNLLKSINQYKTLKYVNQRELKLLGDIENVFGLYNKNLPKVIQAIHSKATILQSDKIIQVDDTPAITALDTLNNSLFSVKPSIWFNLVTDKINLMKRISDFVTRKLINTINDEHDTLIKEFYIIGIITALLVLFLIIFSFFITRNIMQTITSFSKGIFSFFDYINKKTNTVDFLVESNTEIGYISKEVNQNIIRIKIGIEEDKNVINQTIKILKEFEEGDLSKRVNITISNEALNELTNILNKMADNMELNISNVLDVLEEYSDFNFSRKINTEYLKEHLYRLALGVNTLGDSITNVLIDNKKAGITLETIEKQKDNLHNLHVNLKNMHKHTKDSIEYSSLIQHAIVPNKELFSKYFKDYFVIWNPKDIVGGDIYLFDNLNNDNECVFMIIDCTGHGVPGAFVTMLVKAIERQIMLEIILKNKTVSTAYILKRFNKEMKSILKQDNNDAKSNAGFDGAILYYNKKEKIIKFSGANNELFILKDDELSSIKGNRHSIGYRSSDVNYEFTEHIIDVEDNMKFYITTDGYLDQNGGEKGFPFGKKRFKNIIQESHNKSFIDQQSVFLDTLYEYQGKEETNDDITLIAFEI